MHVSTRNATQVRTHAQKYFLRIDRERRKKMDDEHALPSKDRKDGDGYGSGTGDESGSNSSTPDQPGSPMEATSPMSPPSTSAPSSPSSRRKRSSSLISPTQAKSAV